MKVCFYETGGEYHGAAMKLKAALRAKGASVAMYGRPDLGTWWKNVTHKLHIIEKTLQACSEPVLYVDADCELVGDLSGLEVLLGEHDMLVRQREGNVKEKYNVGVMLLANTEKVRKFVTRWREATDAYGHRYETCDQGVFLEMLKEHPLDVGQLPAEYNVLSSDAGKVTNPVLVHKKFSRDNVLLSSWKTERLLERAAVHNLTELLLKPSPVNVWMFGGESAARIPDTYDICLVNRIPVDPCASAWFDHAEDYCTSLRGGQATHTVMATENAWGNTTHYVRHTLEPKPHIGNMPKALTMYYPSAFVTQRAGELCGNAWFAAIQASWLQGAKKLEVACCPDGMRSYIKHVCSAFSLQLRIH